MAEFFGAIMRGLGGALAWIYSFIPSYAIAIVLLTMAVRALLLPLTLKSTKAMAAMQKAQPEMKKIQDKYRAIQRKAKDRMEVQQIRLEMNKELQEVMRAHGANPAAGCLPMFAQFPVLIAMYRVMSAAIPVVVVASLAVGGGPVAASEFGSQNLKDTVCRPPATFVPTGTGSDPIELECPTPTGTKTFRITKFEASKPGEPVPARASWISACTPEAHEGTVHFHCRSAVGAGHLPHDTELFRDVSADKAKVLGMHPGCTATQAQSADKIKHCTRNQKGGPIHSLPYYLLIGAIVATSYYSSRQMNQRTIRQGGQITDQMRLMGRIMPAFFGLISVSLPAGANWYFLIQNFWQIGQQAVQFRAQDRARAAELTAGDDVEDKNEKRREPTPEPVAERRVTAPARPQGSKKRRKKKKR